MRFRERIEIYLELAKARLSALVVATAAVGYVLAGREDTTWWGLLAVSLGTALSAAGANGLNQWWEARPDGCMRRTRNRPLPARRIGKPHALLVSLALCACGVTSLLATCNALAASLALLTIVVYVCVYTPLKRRTTLCTLVGAFVGAVPPMIGWSAATGDLSLGAWLLAALLFLWQIPHFLSLAWMLRQDYERGGFRMLPIVDRGGTVTCRMIVLYSAALVPVGVVLMLAGVSGYVSAVGAAVAGMAMLVLSLRLAHDRSDRNARALFLASIVYLPVLLAILVADRGPVDPAFDARGATIVTIEPIEWTQPERLPKA